MSRKKEKIKYKKERAILSDVLPYEIPITFSNRHFYEFLLQNRVEFINNCIIWNKSDESVDILVKLLFGIKADTPITEELINKSGKMTNIHKINNINKKKLLSIPFTYKISHKENSYRELTICHPRNQLQIIDFYHRFKELILYYCSISQFSIRHPDKVSKFYYHKDRTHYEHLSEENLGIEESNKEYENLRSFFVYKDYSNIYKFYESYNYHNCEKQYNALTKLDITKCFDSIYTHSLSWAILNKETVKNSLSKSQNTFPDIFDRLMQQLNYSETNGIIIGPEFSRIFAEIILQSVDRDVAENLKSKYNILNNTHYKMFRYVDDYFMFYNDNITKEKIVEQIQVQLKEYKLSLNESKARTYDKPIITEISMAKNRIADLLEDKITYNLIDIEVDKEQQPEESDIAKKGSINISSKKLIVQFKTIIKECNVEYKDIMNYSLAIVARKSNNILRKHSLTHKNHRPEKQLVNAIRNILEFVFFIYSVSPRVNTTIKLSRILSTFTGYLKRKDTNKDFKHLVFKDIYDNVCFILNKNINGEYTQVETLYLLVSLSDLGKDYWVSEIQLANIFGLEKDKSENYISKYLLNYFSITVLLFYMRDKKRFNEIRKFIESHIIEKFSTNTTNLRKDAELVMLLLDSLTCPYLSDNTKYTLLNNYGITEQPQQNNVIQRIKYWFTKWDKFDLEKELDAKQSQEVY